MRFLSSNSFDFNQLFYEGLPYVNLKKIRESELRDKYRKLKEELSLGTMMKSPDIAAYINLTWEKVHQWILTP
ncbi:hypothetical protein E6Q11_01465 [Candidatus Dojkabacteria bacterium]|uniref:Uncharacterized protein n=1 Tax=Candidatus Dojkabacteria bacterium TaxID=2099670 RepID=A0A5C7JCL5_9BACT|nr:MAG: hypothetical protein E6Q11_01465 [Candidatus Dojkabacteria bacterium]